MNEDEFNELIARTHAERLKILNGKGVEYSGGEDRLSFFNDVAEGSGTTPLQVWLVMLEKQMFAIRRCVKKGPGYEPVEKIHERICDAMNYLDIGDAMFKKRGKKNVKLEDDKGVGDISPQKV